MATAPSAFAVVPKVAVLPIKTTFAPTPDVCLIPQNTFNEPVIVVDPDITASPVNGKVDVPVKPEPSPI